MISVITNETCFTEKRCSHQTDRKKVLSMIETDSRGSFDHNQTKHIQNGGHAERLQVAIRSKIWPNMRPNVLLKYGLTINN